MTLGDVQASHGGTHAQAGHDWEAAIRHGNGPMADGTMGEAPPPLPEQENDPTECHEKAFAPRVRPKTPRARKRVDGGGWP